MSSRKKIFISILFSLLLHIFLLGMGAYWSLRIPPKPIKPEVVEVTLLPSHYQIADIQPPEKEERPEKSKFVGLYDSRVPEETVAPTRRSAGRRIEARTEKDKINLKEGEGPKVAMKTPKKESPSPEDYFDTGLSEDYFPDYKMGDRTYLNVLRFPKIGYFVRLKKVFRMTFNPIPSLRAAFFATQVSKGQVDVVLGVTVDRSGKLAELKLVRSSGIQGYDQEAIRTVRDSAPFAVPPSELLDAGGTLRMAWTFTVFL